MHGRCEGAELNHPRVSSASHPLCPTQMDPNRDFLSLKLSPRAGVGGTVCCQPAAGQRMRDGGGTKPSTFSFTHRGFQLAAPGGGGGFGPWQQQHQSLLHHCQEITGSQEGQSGLPPVGPPEACISSIRGPSMGPAVQGPLSHSACFLPHQPSPQSIPKRLQELGREERPVSFLIANANKSQLKQM